MSIETPAIRCERIVGVASAFDERTFSACWLLACIRVIVLELLIDWNCAMETQRCMMARCAISMLLLQTISASNPRPRMIESQLDE